MKPTARAWTWMAALLLTLPAHAQEEQVEVIPVDEAPAEEAPVEETAPAEAMEAPVGEAAADASAEAPTEEAPAEEAPAEEVASEEPAEPLALYVGADWVMTTLSVSAPLATGADQFDSGMYRGRVGMRALEAIGLEVQFGIDNSDDEPGSVETKSYYGLFVVPTATVFEVVELAFPVGYAQSEFGAGGSGSDSLRSIAYGVDGELPLRTFGAELPDIRLTAGWMIYYQKSDARAYGANAGLRYDFQTTGFGNPLAGIGGALGKLWPFGGDEEAAPAE
jgi:hypothetical protein